MKTIKFSILSLIILNSCSSKKEIINIESTRIYKEVPLNSFPNEKGGFNYKNFTVYFFLFPNGKLKKIENLNTKKINLDSIKVDNNFNGVYYSNGKNNFINYENEDEETNITGIVMDKFAFKNDSLILNNGKKKFIKISN